MTTARHLRIAIGGDLAKLSGHAISTNPATLITASAYVVAPKPRRRLLRRHRQMVDLREVRARLMVYVDGVPFADATDSLDIRPGGEWMSITPV